MDAAYHRKYLRPDRSILIHFEPVTRPGLVVPRKYRRVAVKLSSKLSPQKVAALFDVTTQTVYRWASQHRQNLL